MISTTTNLLKKTILLVSTVINLQHSFAQKDEKFSYEQVKQQCAGLPLEKRARLSVTRFSVSTKVSTESPEEKEAANRSAGLAMMRMIYLKKDNTNKETTTDQANKPTLGDNLSTMLTNALQGVNCFRVLESLSNNKDMTEEINQGQSNLSSGKAPKAGKQLGAQIVVTGEIVEFSEGNKKSDVFGIKSEKKKVKMGFTLKMINPETRDVIASNLFRVESKVKSGGSVFGFAENSSNEDPAKAAALEDGVIKAVEFMAHIKDSLNISADNIPGSVSKDPNAVKDIEIKLAGATFSTFNGLAGILSTMSTFKSMEKSFKDGLGDFTVSHVGTADAFLDELGKKMGDKFDITGFDDTKIEVKVK